MANKKAGKPTKITPEVIKGMKNYMIAGLTLKDACELLDIGTTTWRDYERKNPDMRRKRKGWQGMLKARSKMLIADQIINRKDVSTAVWYLERADRLEDKNARNELTRAQAKKYRIEAELAEKQNLQVDNATNATVAKMKDLSLEELRALAKMAQGNEDK
ncbi:hypothetical protein J2Z60_001784 [Lactobacillus colini]|uniref:Uncharacterized protein n=1 Tax=Lactobacillus colini TaxID=1819254 RepID=A0ABS4MFX7_9LACO|nr:hypothetical protein [Lactobacillus colini]MBP2058596.1 hypothetical protein [Lactobacillus colini]